MSTQNSNSKIPARGWLIVSIGWVAMFIVSFGSYGLGIILPAIREEFSMSLQQAGYFSSINFIVQTIVFIPVSLTATRINPKKVLLFVYACLAGAYFCHAFAQSATVLYLGRVLLALGAAGVTGPMVLVKTNWIPKDKITMVTGLEYFIKNGGQLLAMAGATALIALLGGWKQMLGMLGCIAVLLIFGWLGFYKQNENGPAIVLKEKGPFLKPFLNAAKQYPVWAFGIGMCGTSIAWTAFNTFWPTYATETLGLSLTSAGIAIGIVPFASAIASITAPAICRAIGKDKIMLWPWGIILPLAYFGALKASNPVLLYILFFIAGYGAFAFVPISMATVYKLDGIEPSAVSLGIAIIMTLMNLGNTLAGIIAGQLGQSFGLQTALTVCCFAPIIWGVLTFFVPELGRKAMEEKAAKNAQQ